MRKDAKWYAAATWQPRKEQQAEQKGRQSITQLFAAAAAKKQKKTKTKTDWLAD